MTAPVLIRASGPADPPSSRPRSGVLGGAVFAYAFDAADGEQRLSVPGLEAVDATADTLVHWAFYADGEAAVTPPYAPLAVTIDVVDADGARLSADPRVRDRYGFALTAAAQFDARWSMPEQWNADTVSLAPWAGRRVGVEVVLGLPGGAGERVSGFIEVLIEQATVQHEAEPLALVDTRRGTHSGDAFSRGNTIPAVAVPHGFLFVTPATDATNTRWPYRPYRHDDPAGRRLEALALSHQPSPWIGDRTVLHVQPFRGAPVAGPAQRRRHIVPGSEVAAPHTWSADLVGGDTIEATATSRVAAFRVRGEGELGFIIDQPDARGALRVDGPDTFSGWIGEGSATWGNAPRAFFAGRVVRGVTGTAPADAVGAPWVGAVHGQDEVEVRIAQSFLSVAQARRTLELEAGAEREFDDLRDAAAAQWRPLLSAVTIPPLPAEDVPYRALAHRENRARLAAALHRLHLYPNTAAENRGTHDAPQWAFADPMVPAGVHGETETGAPIADGELMVNNGYWDTYRTVWPAFAILDPDGAAVLLDGVLMQDRRGGYMARWSAPGYVDSMVGTSSDQIFADADAWGIALDADAAYESAWRNACEPAPRPDRGRAGIDRARFVGYVDRETREGMSWSLENAVSDAAIGRWARRRAEAGADAARWDAHARYFANRALSYRALFDPDTGFFRGRGRDGAFAEPFDRRVWGGDNVETNAWGMSVAPVHDGAGLAALHGGPAALGDHLDRLFAEVETAAAEFGGTYGTVIHEQREARAQRSGMCAISNQPAHHIPYMYAHTDRPHLATRTVRDLAGRLFAGAHLGQGFPGDEDNGEMSAWWLWAALGLYPLELASGRLFVGVPLFDDLSVVRPDGSTLRIRVHRASAAADVLTGVRVDGVALDEPWVDVRALAAASELELEVGEEEASVLAPRAAAVREYRADLTSGPGHSVGGVAAFDDRASGVDLPLGPDAVAGWIFDAPTVVTDVSVTTAASAACDDLLWEATIDGQTWSPLPMTHAEALSADRTTPFRVAAPSALSGVRVRARRPVVLRQLELFTLD
ncbi:glycoside hydrolase domain-containing protein [Microbacterium gorillae]|uniref:glycoside hydrolase domain-containing protein n=1 Tax=Microbacterium gorillae TaxID=1231063 RepID=UPI000A7FF8CF|nr:glycoside hydrolase domain-containing protein [Microbacterium gorillae]